MHAFFPPGVGLGGFVVVTAVVVPNADKTPIHFLADDEKSQYTVLVDVHKTI